MFVQPFADLATGTEHERQAVQLFSQLNDEVSFSVEDIHALIEETGTGDAYVLLRAKVADVPDELLAGASGSGSTATCTPPLWAPRRATLPPGERRGVPAELGRHVPGGDGCAVPRSMLFTTSVPSPERA